MVVIEMKGAHCPRADCCGRINDGVCNLYVCTSVDKNSGRKVNSREIRHHNQYNSEMYLSRFRIDYWA